MIGLDHEKWLKCKRFCPQQQVECMFFLPSKSQKWGYVWRLSSYETLPTAVTQFFSFLGDVLNIDPLKFYTHLYKTLISLHAGDSQSRPVKTAALTLSCVCIHIRNTRSRSLRGAEWWHHHRAAVPGRDADQAQEAGDPAEGDGVRQAAVHAQYARAAQRQHRHHGRRPCRLSREF